MQVYRVISELTEFTHVHAGRDLDPVLVTVMVYKGCCSTTTHSVAVLAGMEWGKRATIVADYNVQRHAGFTGSHHVLRDFREGQHLAHS